MHRRSEPTGGEIPRRRQKQLPFVELGGVRDGVQERKY
jgi:hypothetical protein